MNGLKWSDETIVAVKAANKAERSAAESLEGRVSSNGNPDDQSTRRTQSRESVSQAIGRIRKAATRKPKEKLTALMHHITLELLFVKEKQCGGG